MENKGEKGEHIMNHELDSLEYRMLETSASVTQKNENEYVSVSRLVFLLVISVLVTSGQLVLAQVTHSITLLTLVHNNIYIVLTLIVSLATYWKSEKSLVSWHNTFGWRRMEVVGSISSLVFLFSLCFATAIEALQTLFHNNHLDTMHHPEWIMIIVGVNFWMWIVSFFTIGGYSYHQNLAVAQRKHKLGSLANLNLSNTTTQHYKTQTSFSLFLERIRLADVSRDLAGCFFTFITCSIVYFNVVTEEYSAHIDPVISLFYIVFLIASSVTLVRDSCLILLQTIPGNVEFLLLEKYLLSKFPGILSLHEFHTWTFTPGKLVLTGHIMYQNKSVYIEINSQVEAFFRSQGFSMITIQPEFPPPLNSSLQELPTDCALKCKDDNCIEKVCCKDEDVVSM